MAWSQTNGACPWLITETWLATDCYGQTNSCTRIVTIAGVLCIAKHIREHWKNEQEQEFEIEATRYVANSLPAASP